MFIKGHFCSLDPSTAEEVQRRITPTPAETVQERTTTAQHRAALLPEARHRAARHRANLHRPQPRAYATGVGTH